MPVLSAPSLAPHDASASASRTPPLPSSQPRLPSTATKEEVRSQPAAEGVAVVGGLPAAWHGHVQVRHAAIAAAGVALH